MSSKPDNSRVRLIPDELHGELMLQLFVDGEWRNLMILDKSRRVSCERIVERLRQAFNEERRQGVVAYGIAVPRSDGALPDPTKLFGDRVIFDRDELRDAMALYKRQYPDVELTPYELRVSVIGEADV